MKATKRMYPKVCDVDLAKYIVADVVSEQLLPYRDGEVEELRNGVIVKSTLTKEQWKEKRISLFFKSVQL